MRRGVSLDVGERNGRDQFFEGPFKIQPDVGIRVLIDGEPGCGVGAENQAHSLFEVGRCRDSVDFPGDLFELDVTAGVHVDLLFHLTPIIGDLQQQRHLGQAAASLDLEHIEVLHWQE